MATDLFTEKYRPNEFEEIVGFDQSQVPLFKENLPNLLLVGRPGTGKTTLARVIIKKGEHEHLLLNASDERGIDTIREKVKMFAMSSSLNGKLRVVFLDEADYLTTEAQTSLRNVIESFHKVCRFILTANYKSKIIEPLQSRCTLVEFSSPPRKEILGLMKIICKDEGYNVDENALKTLIDTKYPDIRGMVNLIQQYKLSNKTMTQESLMKISVSEVKEIFGTLLAKNFTGARQLYLDSGMDENELIKGLYKEVMGQNWDADVKCKMIHHMAECLKWLPSVAIKHILVEEMMSKMIGEI